MMYEKFDMWLHIPSWNPTCVQSFRFVLFMVFELQGSKLNKKKKKKKQKNWENELFVISPLLVMQFLPYFRYTCMLPIAIILQQQNWIHIESESLNWNFSKNSSRWSSFIWKNAHTALACGVGGITRGIGYIIVHVCNNTTPVSF